MVFQGKRIDFRITGISENLCFTTKKLTIYFQNKNKWQIAPDLHKKSEKCDTSRNYEIFFCYRNQKRERWERGEESKNSKERGGSKRARQDLMMMIMMNGVGDGDGHDDGDGGDDDDDDGGKGLSKGKEERTPILIHSLTPDCPPLAAITGI